MKSIIRIGGNVAAVLGILICLVAAIARMSGYHFFLGYEAMSLFIAGIGLMVMGCLGRLYSI